MERQLTFFIALLIAAALVRALMRGDVAAADGIGRAEYPRFYWGIISSGFGALAVLLVLALQAAA